MHDSGVINALLVAAAVAAAMLLGAGLLHLLPRLGRPGRAASGAMTRAPALDLWITYFTILPLAAGPVWAGWWGLLGAVVGQVGGVLIWTGLHELAHPQARRGPRIVKVINAKVGVVRNMTAVWLTAIVVPMFWIVRMAQVGIYPWLTLLVGLPAYRHAEWVNVSRQKFSGLVGHDLVWCLYCDWMTGVWSLGSEMLRNVESFWCPIRFASEKKCERCRQDFPDIDGGWIPADGTMNQVTDLLERVHDRHHGWFGHPARLTVEGTPVMHKPDGGAHEQPAAGAVAPPSGGGGGGGGGGG
ncbi:MAG: hypothetical protein JJU36_18375, partial [Phycisphaeraceae bacterium]|nr:hypothetical protein [Phycisphaeraceae bacterium]